MSDIHLNRNQTYLIMKKKDFHARLTEVLFKHLDTSRYGLAYVKKLDCICLYQLDNGLVGSPPEKLPMEIIKDASDAKNYFCSSYYVNLAQNPSYFNNVVADFLCHDESDSRYGNYLLRHSFSLFQDILHQQMNDILRKMKDYPEKMLNFISRNNKDFLSVNASHFKETIALLNENNTKENVAIHVSQYLFKRKNEISSIYVKTIKELVIKEFSENLDLFLSIEGIGDYLDFKNKTAEKKEIFKVYPEYKKLHLEVNVKNLMYQTMMDGFSLNNYEQMLKNMFKAMKMKEDEIVENKEYGVQEVHVIDSAYNNGSSNIFLIVTKDSFLNEDLLQDYVIDFIHARQNETFTALFGNDMENWIKKYWLHKKISLALDTQTNEWSEPASQSFKL
jgi:hypothetical protein